MLFDLGGVLINIDFHRTFRYWQQFSMLSEAQMLQRFKQDVAYAQHETGELTAENYFIHIREQLQLDATDAQIKEGWNALLLDEIDTTVSLLKRIAPIIPCYLFSNSNTTHQTVWMERHNELMQLFRKTFVSSDIGLRKPDARAFEWVASQIGVDCQHILFFDDLAENVSGAIATGMQAVHVTGPATVSDTLEKLGISPG